MLTKISQGAELFVQMNVHTLRRAMYGKHIRIERCLWHPLRETHTIICAGLI